MEQASLLARSALQGNMLCNLGPAKIVAEAHTVGALVPLAVRFARLEALPKQAVLRGAHCVLRAGSHRSKLRPALSARQQWFRMVGQLCVKSVIQAHFLLQSRMSAGIVVQDPTRTEVWQHRVLCAQLARMLTSRAKQLARNAK